MAEVVNLRQVRKAKQRAEHDAAAEQNRIKFGLTKAERNRSKAEQTELKRRIDGHKLTEPPAGDGA